MSDHDRIPHGESEPLNESGWPEARLLMMALSLPAGLLLVVLALLLTACAPTHPEARHIVATTTTVALTTTTQAPAPAATAVSRASRKATRPRGSRSSGAVAAPVAPSGAARSVSSTAYCLTGTMANGQRTYSGAVAMNGVPMGSRWRVLSGPMAGVVLTVADRIGHSSGFDIAMPGDCAGARAYGRRSITIEPVHP